MKAFANRPVVYYVRLWVPPPPTHQTTSGSEVGASMNMSVQVDPASESRRDSGGHHRRTSATRERNRSNELVRGADN